MAPSTFPRFLGANAAEAFQGEFDAGGVVNKARSKIAITLARSCNSEIALKRTFSADREIHTDARQLPAKPSRHRHVAPETPIPNIPRLRRFVCSASVTRRAGVSPDWRGRRAAGMGRRSRKNRLAMIMSRTLFEHERTHSWQRGTGENDPRRSSALGIVTGSNRRNGACRQLDAINDIQRRSDPGDRL